PFTFEPTTGSLWRGGALLSLLPKDAAVLAVLVQQAGQVGLKEALLEAVWPETYVTETVLKNSIARLRRLLGGTLTAPHYIETRARRGYRFLAPVEALALEHAGHAPPSAVIQLLVPCPLVPSHMVGREAELALLHERFALARRGQRQVVWITGEAGIGKTALLEAFMAKETARKSLWLAHGQCVEHYGEGEAYLPVLEALGHWCRGPGGQQVLTELQRYAPTWLVQMPALLTEAELARVQRQAEGVTRERMVREMAEALEALTVDRALVLVLEDVHWSDKSTVDLLAYLAQRGTAACLLVLGTYRPADLVRQAHPLHGLKQELQAHGQCAEVRLEELTAGEVEAYVTQRLGPQAPP